MNAEKERTERTVASFTKVRDKFPPSRNGTAVPPAPNIIDDSGRSWTFSRTEDHGGYIPLRDGKRLPGTGVLLLWWEGKVYLKNAPGAWFVWDEETWLQTGNPAWFLGT